MKFLVIFAVALACAHAVNLPYIISSPNDSSEEEYRVIVPVKGETDDVDSVKVKVPRLLTPDVKQQIIKQTLAARGYGSILSQTTGAPL
ncbi:uncharacterized protein LOC126762832 [Bactrocera neohumeralis]|uniref:uncharacterized protein LOC120778406 n=1 Tax=Bactrocera tryoni TaxID=59916 RepID=UPI001A97FCB0|nr:uncharacterized protein LOC120778406 [Bactrocera tryoni]XP_050335830.1 uncharacterized protein LOC126762832 [Bactrocera neohumeralis]